VSQHAIPTPAGPAPTDAKEPSSRPSETELGGYSLVNAGSLDEAVTLAGSCPILAAGGGIEVGAVTVLDPETMGALAADRSAGAVSTG
jgi:hypothetical protein